MVETEEVVKSYLKTNPECGSKYLRRGKVREGWWWGQVVAFTLIDYMQIKRNHSYCLPYSYLSILIMGTKLFSSGSSVIMVFPWGWELFCKLSSLVGKSFGLIFIIVRDVFRLFVVHQCLWYFLQIFSICILSINKELISNFLFISYLL